jgi:hypothetical protein
MLCDTDIEDVETTRNKIEHSREKKKFTTKRKKKTHTHRKKKRRKEKENKEKPHSVFNRASNLCITSASDSATASSSSDSSPSNGSLENSCSLTSWTSIDVFGDVSPMLIQRERLDAPIATDGELFVRSVLSSSSSSIFYEKKTNTVRKNKCTISIPLTSIKYTAYLERSV